MPAQSTAYSQFNSNIDFGGVPNGLKIIVDDVTWAYNNWRTDNLVRNNGTLAHNPLTLYCPDDTGQNCIQMQ